MSSSLLLLLLRSGGFCAVVLTLVSEVCIRSIVRWMVSSKGSFSSEVEKDEGWGVVDLVVDGLVVDGLVVDGLSLLFLELRVVLLIERCRLG